MRVNIGQVEWWDSSNQSFKDCKLNLNDYDVNLLFNDGTKIKTKIADDIFHLIEVDEDEDEDEDQYLKTIFVSSQTGNLVQAFVIDKSKIREISNHFNGLNNILRKRQEFFLQKVNKRIVDITMEYKEIKQLIYNFLDKTNKFLFVDSKKIICFERYLLVKFRLGKLTLQTNSKKYRSLLNFQSVIQDLDFGNENVELNIIEYYEESFLKLLKIIKKKINFETDEEGVFVVWKLLSSEACHYYYNLFNNEYGDYIPNVEFLSLHECIMAYIKIDLIDIKLASNASLFTYYLMHLDKFYGRQNYIVCNDILLDQLLKHIEEKELNDFETSLMATSTTNEYKIEDVDLMSGQEFENFVAHLFRKMGYSTEVTKTSGDQGIDVIVEKNGKKIGIQTKCYSNTVSNKAIQEVVAGIKYYQLTKGIVITNNYFTESAKILAHSNEVVIWDRSILKEKISEVF